MKYAGKNTLAMLGIAAVTMVATLAVLSPRGADAADSKDAKTAKTLKSVTASITTPKLNEDNCAMTLKADKDKYTVGDKPVLTVSVTNNGKQAVDKEVTVSMLNRSLISFGRMPAAPLVVWTKTQVVSVEAGKTATVDFKPDVAITAKQATSFRMSGEKDEVSRPARLNRVAIKAIRDLTKAQADKAAADKKAAEAAAKKDKKVDDLDDVTEDAVSK